MDKAQNIFLKDLNLMPSLKKLLKMHRAGTPAWNVYVCTCALMKVLIVLLRGSMKETFKGKVEIGSNNC